MNYLNAELPAGYVFQDNTNNPDLPFYIWEHHIFYKNSEVYGVVIETDSGMVLTHDDVDALLSGRPF